MCVSKIALNQAMRGPV